MEIYHEGQIYKQRYERGNVCYKLKIVGECEPERTGTKVTFLPDKEIFEETVFDYDTLKIRLRETAFLTKNLKITLRDDREEKTLAAVSANVSANLLGLGNAATPLGIQAARRMARGCGGVASDELCLLVVLNTASIQLLPATIASVRSASGCETPFDILPAVWLASALSVLVGVTAAKLLAAAGRCRR